MLARALRAAMFDPRPYREVGADPELVLQSLGYVVLAALAFGIGFRNLPENEFASRTFIILLSISTVLTGWLLWTLVTYVLGTLIFRGTAGYRVTLRALGVAYGPGVLMAFQDEGEVGRVVFLVGMLWLLAGGIVAVREIQGYDWVRSFVAAAAGWTLAFLVLPFIIFLPAPAS